MIVRILALLSLIVCLLSAFLLFMEQISNGGYKTLFALASLSWFIFATIAIRRPRRDRS